jgi:hypothetical protein
MKMKKQTQSLRSNDNLDLVQVLMHLSVYASIDTHTHSSSSSSAPRSAFGYDAPDNHSCWSGDGLEPEGLVQFYVG